MKASVCCMVVVCLLSLASAGLSQSGKYLFSTIAGTPGVVGSTDGTNGAAEFDFPGALAIDASGNLFLSDILNNTIRKATPLGTNWVVTTIAGQAAVSGAVDGTNNGALFDRPNGIAIDQDGNLFVVDHYNYTIRQVVPSGTNWIVTTIAGQVSAHGSADGTNSDARFWSPTGIAVGTNNHLYVTDTANFTIREIARFGTNWVVSTIAGTALNFGFADGTNGDAQFNVPGGIIADRDGRLYVADSGNNVIRQLQQAGTNWVVTTVAGSAVAMGTNDGPGQAATFDFPNSVCVDRSGNLYVTDQSNDTIRKIEPSGGDWTVSTIGGAGLQAGSANGLGDVARFKHPWGIAVDATGKLYVADYANQTIRQGEFIPLLRVNLALGRVVLSWGASETQYVPQSSASLGAGAVWTALTNAPVTNGLNLITTDQPGNGTVFYRLRMKTN